MKNNYQGVNTPSPVPPLTVRERVKQFSAKVLLFCLMFYQAQANAQCNNVTYAVAANNCSFDYITSVTFSSISNLNSGCNAFSLNSANIPNLTQGQAYVLTVVTDGDWEGVRAWIDYNIDGVFANTAATELVMGPSYVGSVPTTYIATVTIPFSATPGLTRLRVRCNYSQPPADATTAQTWGETEDYCVNIISSTPCSGTPPTNTVLPLSYNTCPVLNNPGLSLAQSYTLGGITYQWQSSTVSPVGPFTSVPNATSNTMPVPSLTTTTWYQAVITCANSNISVSLTPSTFSVAGTTTNSVPYNEDFEGIAGPNRLPNCSWSATNLNTATQTYTNSNSNNRQPRSGNNFAAFQNSPTGTNYFWTNGIQLEPGITYSAGLWYATEYFGYNNWSSLSILVGNTQTTTGLTTIASVSPAISGPYKALGGYFTVPSSGLYYIAIRAVSASGNAIYLSWDDLSVTIPCTAASGNQPTVSLSASSTTICSGDQVSLNASGAMTYQWSNGGTGATQAVTPAQSTTYIVTGSNTITSCAQSASVAIQVDDRPNVWVAASAPLVCPGESSMLQAYGGTTYMWSNNATGNPVQVTPASTTTYVASSTGSNGCIGTGSIVVAIKPTPTINASGTTANDMCAGETLTLTGTGGQTYQWISSTGSLYAGSPVNIPVFAPVAFTVTGTGSNGCSAKATVQQNVAACTSISENGKAAAGLSVYPNPGTGLFTVEVKSGLINNIQISDVSGRMIKSVEGGSSSVMVDLTGLAAGIYYATIDNGNSGSVVRIIKN